MTRRPNSAVSVPGDVFEGVTQWQVGWAAEFIAHQADLLRGLPAAHAHAVAAMLRRLAPYLPSEATQEADNAG